MPRQYIAFKDLPVKASFGLNGNKCTKRSTRTLQLLEFNRWFYCGKNTLCVVGSYSMLSANYFIK